MVDPRNKDAVRAESLLDCGEYGRGRVSGHSWSGKQSLHGGYITRANEFLHVPIQETPRKVKEADEVKTDLRSSSFNVCRCKLGLMRRDCDKT